MTIKKIRESLLNSHSTKGIDLWNKASEVVLGGCGLLSKRPTRYSSRTWPTYMKESKDIFIKSLDNITYADFTEFSIGCCLLGYRSKSHNSILKLLKKQSPLSTLLSPYEPELAFKLNEFFSESRVWKFCRGGGEALAITARLARAISTNTRILVCGYHGTHDWYLSSNLSIKDGLSQIFLKGITPNGIPHEYSGTTINISQLNAQTIEHSIQSHHPGIIFFEACRYKLLDQNCVKLLQKFQNEGGILVADEVTSGFRFNSKLATFECGIIPDFIVLGKSLGNGYAISAVGALKKYHDNLQECFLSSTYWTESIGLRAGILTLEAFNDWETIISQLNTNGMIIHDMINKAFNASRLQVTINNIPTMINFEILPQLGFTSIELRTLLISRMLKLGFLFSTTIYPSIRHTRHYSHRFGSALSSVCSQLGDDMLDNSSLLRIELEKIGPVEQGFSRTQKL
ncbi:3-aminobutyryl-CoA aminotransferase [Prochlorococcus marinus str. MIT 1313]|uniref:aminotransferase class III-fold pyridoxal phosphate-dependent enzyme n=1 Tax=Prochlorococcus TaxID=1218 RepID=UPI0007BC0A35|nr:aminotransferase class III-fold pyridoxal phosphate-dependent enzyme [Prochlorococcus marinus]KZR70260.1 3-aminobutyryl-CoA aminotransferase [Prochlorococcus marinus str. MIT 1313]KZR70732.1 3-aminobutyryl-CoA aminotransferase [Prochlorococcus marinus str. MIT 1318]